MSHRDQTIIGLFARGRELGYAIFEGDELVRFGVKTIRGRKTRARLLPVLRRFLADLMSIGERVPTVAAECHSATDPNCGALRRALNVVLIGLDDGATDPSRHSLAEAKAQLCSNENATHRELMNAVERRNPALLRKTRRTPTFGLPEGSAATFAVALAETHRQSL